MFSHVIRITLLLTLVGCGVIIDTVRDGYETDSGYWITIEDDGVQVTYPRPKDKPPSLPETCHHLYDNGSKWDWADCMGVGRK